MSENDVTYRDWYDTLPTDEQAKHPKPDDVFKLLTEPAHKPTLCLDFDGVIHSYASGWQGETVIPDPPVDGAIEFLYEAVKHFEVCIFSTRSATVEGRQAMCRWLIEWDDAYRSEHHIRGSSLAVRIKFPATKPAALVGIDDRVLTFTGTFPDVQTLRKFKPWNKK